MKSDSAAKVLGTLKIPKSTPARPSPPPPSPEPGVLPPEDFGEKFANRKISVSLFTADLKAVDHIIDLLRQHCGVRATPSDAIKMALRLAAPDFPPAKLQELFRQVKNEDVRRKVR